MLDRVHHSKAPCNCGLGYRVSFTLAGSRLDATWSPHPPTGRDMRRVMDRYRAARSYFLADVARTTGKTISTLEVLP